MQPNVACEFKRAGFLEGRMRGQCCRHKPWSSALALASASASAAIESACPASHRGFEDLQSYRIVLPIQDQGARPDSQRGAIALAIVAKTRKRFACPKPESGRGIRLDQGRMSGNLQSQKTQLIKTGCAASCDSDAEKPYSNPRLSRYSS